jgi:hypothetical protein
VRLLIVFNPRARRGEKSASGNLYVMSVTTISAPHRANRSLKLEKIRTAPHRNRFELLKMISASPIARVSFDGPGVAGSSVVRAIRKSYRSNH